MKIFDCTLRDGANVVGKGFSAKMTTMMIEAMINSGIDTIEFGNCKGIGAYEGENCIAPLSDPEYLELAKPYVDKAELGMFMLATYQSEKNAVLASEAGIGFLRVGATGGDAEKAIEAVKTVKAAGLKCYYSAMRCYLVSPEELAEEAKMLVDCGLDVFTMMDSAGTMLPKDVERYVETVTKRVSIPVGFHGHNNLGMSVANAISAYQAGAQYLDAGLMGMARSAGNCATEVLMAILQRMGLLKELDLNKLLAFIDEELAPMMLKFNYHAPLCPRDLILGMAGCSSGYQGMLKEVADEYAVPYYRLIVEVSAIDRKAPSRALAEKVAQQLKG